MKKLLNNPLLIGFFLIVSVFAGIRIFNTFDPYLGIAVVVAGVLIFGNKLLNL